MIKIKSFKRWQYCGDIDIRYGGYFFRDEGDADFMPIVEVVPASDGGGPDNVFQVETGWVFMPVDDVKRMRNIASICGYTVHDDGALDAGRGNVFRFQSPEWRAAYLDACKAYHGIEDDDRLTRVVHIGPAERDASGWLSNVEPDFVLRANASLRNFVRREFL